MFKGTYTHKIDPKGRMPVPAAFRRELAGGGSTSVVVTLLDQCLAVYPHAEWARLEQQLAALPAFSAPVKALTRHLTSRAIDCELDVQGRILLPPTLRDAVKLAREATVVGVLNRFEIWVPAVWTSFLQDSERLLEDVSLDVQWPPAPPAAPPALRASGHPQGKPNR